MYYYIINPAAGNGKIDKIQKRLKGIIKRLGIEGEFVKTTGAADVYKLTNIALDKARNTIVAVGGDGTVNEVANALVDRKAVLGIIPIGKTNSVARTLGVFSWEEACQILAARKLEKIDLAKVTTIPQKPSQKVEEKYFLTSAELGFESQITKYRVEDNSFYKLLFARKVIKEVFKNHTEKITIEVNGNFTATTVMFTLIVSNCQISRQSKKFRPNPADRQLDILLVSKLPRWQLIRNIMAIIDKKYEDLSSTSIFKAKSVKVITPTPQDLSIDGEIFIQTPVEIEVVPQKLKVIVGKKRSF